MERKSIDITFDGDVFGHDRSQTAGGTGDAYCLLLSGIAAGSDYDERIGRKVVLKDLLLTGSIQLDNATQYGQRAHIVVVKDKVPTGTLPAPNLIYDKFGLRVLENTPRFQVLMSKTFNLRPTTAPDVTPTVVQSESRFFFRRIAINDVATYSGATAGLGDISGNGIYLILWTETSTSADVLIQGKARLRFSEQ